MKSTKHYFKKGRGGNEVKGIKWRGKLYAPVELIALLMYANKDTKITNKRKLKINQNILMKPSPLAVHFSPQFDF
jgi:hypothetical protein